MALSLLVYACCFLTFSSKSCSPEVISRLTFTCPCSCFSFVVSRQGWSALMKAIYWYFEFVSLHNIKASHSYWCETERIKNWMGQRVESWMWLSGKGLSGSGILLVFFDISERWVSCLFWCFAAASTSSFLFFPFLISMNVISTVSMYEWERDGKETRKKKRRAVKRMLWIFHDDNEQRWERWTTTTTLFENGIRENITQKLTEKTQRQMTVEIFQKVISEMELWTQRHKRRRRRDNIHSGTT